MTGELGVIVNVTQYRDMHGGGGIYAEGLLSVLADICSRKVLAAAPDQRWCSRVGEDNIIVHNNEFLHPRSLKEKVQRLCFDSSVLPSARKVSKILETDNSDVVHFPGDRLSPFKELLGIAKRRIWQNWY